MFRLLTTLIFINITCTLLQGVIRPVGWTNDGEFVIIRDEYCPDDHSVKYILEIIDVFNNNILEEKILCTNEAISCDGEDIDYLLELSKSIIKNYDISIDTSLKLYNFPYTIENFNYTYRNCELSFKKERLENDACKAEYISGYDLMMQSQSYSYPIYSENELNNTVNVEMKGFYKSPDSYLFAIVLTVYKLDDTCREYSNEIIVGFAALPEEE